MNNGTAYMRKDGRWECRLSLGKGNNGKRLFKSFYGKTKEEAVLKLKMAAQIAEDYAETEMTVNDLVQEWLIAAKNRIKESTAANYFMKAEKHIIPAFGLIQCCELKVKQVYTFIEDKLKSGLSPRYVSDILVLMKSIFRYASKEYRIKNVLDGISMPKCEKTEVEMLNTEQKEQLWKHVENHSNRTSLAIVISMKMGLRIGEVCALKWSNIDLTKRTLTVTQTVQRVQCKNGSSKTKLIITAPKSSKSLREIPIPEVLMPIFRSFKGESDTYVMTGKNKPLEPRALQYRFAKILKNEGLPSVHFHSLRHLFSTDCIALGFDMKTLSEILGHSSVEITLSRYVHSSLARKRACMDLIST